MRELGWMASGNNQRLNYEDFYGSKARSNNPNDRERKNYVWEPYAIGSPRQIHTSSTVDKEKETKKSVDQGSSRFSSLIDVWKSRSFRMASRVFDLFSVSNIESNLWSEETSHSFH